MNQDWEWKVTGFEPVPAPCVAIMLFFTCTALPSTDRYNMNHSLFLATRHHLWESPNRTVHREDHTFLHDPVPVPLLVKGVEPLRTKRRQLCHWSYTFETKIGLA